MHNPKNLEVIPAGGSHPLDITFLTHANGVPVNPDGYTAPDDPSPQISVDFFIYDEGAATYNAPPGAYEKPILTDLRYAGTTGRFLVTADAPAGITRSDQLTGERWAIGWTTTIGGNTRTFFEFVTIVDSPSASFGVSGYCDIACVREDTSQLTRDETYTISADSPATIEVITLPDNETKQIVHVKVNDNDLTSGWTFRKPSKIEFTPSLALGDVVEIKRDVCMTDEQINKQIVAVSNYITGQLTKVYTVPFAAPYPPLIRDLCMKLSSAEIRMKLFDSTDREGDRRGREQWERWHFKLMELKEESVELVDDDGNLLPIIGGSGVLMEPRDLEPLFSLNDIKDVHAISNRTGWNYRRRGF